MPEPIKRPGTVMFVAIVLFVTGGVYLLNSLGTSAFTAFVAANPEPANPNAKVEPGNVMANQRFFIKEIPFYVPSILAFCAIDFLLGATKIFLGRQVLRLRSWARLGTIAFVVFELCYLLAYKAYTAIIIIPAQVEFTRLHPIEVPGGGPAPVDLATMTQITLYAGLGCTVFMELLAAMLISLPLTMATTKAAFAGTLDVDVEPLPERPRTRYAGYDDEGY